MSGQENRERAFVRETMLRERARMTPGEHREMDGRIIAHITASPLWREARSVFGYLPVKGEPDLTALYRQAAVEGKIMAYPVCLNDSEMAFYTVDTPEDTAPGRYGIPEPVIRDEEHRVRADIETLILIPALAFDTKGYRLGYGKGYYDRYLTDARDAKTVIAAYSFQEMTKIVPTPVDKAAGWIVTENGFRHRGR